MAYFGTRVDVIGARLHINQSNTVNNLKSWKQILVIQLELWSCIASAPACTCYLCRKHMLTDLVLQNVTLHIGLNLGRILHSVQILIVSKLRQNV